MRNFFCKLESVQHACGMHIQNRRIPGYMSDLWLSSSKYVELQISSIFLKISADSANLTAQAMFCSKQTRKMFLSGLSSSFVPRVSFPCIHISTEWRHEEGGFFRMTPSLSSGFSFIGVKGIKYGPASPIVIPTTPKMILVLRGKRL